MPVTIDEVEKIASLAALDLSPDEARELVPQMAALVDFVEEMGEVAGETDEQPASGSVIAAPERPDVPVPGLDRETVLANAPEHRRGHVALAPLRRPIAPDSDSEPDPRETG